jgi:pimeloyl-[acyl-carrier protein] methyl ester esterase
LERDGGRRIYFEDRRGDGRPVMLIHGWAMSGRVWDTTAAALTRDGHRVITFDQRGCGLSDKDFDDCTVAASAGDAVALSQTLGLEGVVLNGWSLGGAVAVEAAATLGEACGGVILTCGASPRYTQAPDFPHGGTVEGVMGVIDALARDRATFLHGVSRAVCARPVGQPVEDWMWSIFMQSAPCADAGMADLAGVDQRELIAALSAPLLAIVGSADAFTPPEIGEAAARLARDGAVERFEGCGHAPFLEDYARYIQVTRAFLSRLA